MVALPLTPRLSPAPRDKDEESLLPTRNPLSSGVLRASSDRWASAARRKLAVIAAGLILVAFALTSLYLSTELPPLSAGRWTAEWRPNSAISVENRTPGVQELLTKSAPSSSIYNSLVPQLRYLFFDSWSGMSGQFTSALAALYLGRITQRIVVIPSWHDETHYGSSTIRMSLLFDMEKFRRETGILFVELDDVKFRGDWVTKPDEIGCFRASPWFETGEGFPRHNIQQRTLNSPGLDYSYEGLAFFDANPALRLEAAAAQAKAEGFELPRNIREEREGASNVICLTNLWDVGNVGGGQGGGHSGHYGNGPWTPKESKISELLRPELRGVHPEWWEIGRHIDFAPAIWDVALDAVHRTLEVDHLPPLVTVHLRRGDFLTWCDGGHNCTPPVDAYETAIRPLLALLTDAHLAEPLQPLVLVTTDDSDQSFLQSIRDLKGWCLVDHVTLGTAQRLKQMLGQDWKWADAAVDQAILSLGSHFVGTRGSQVSQLSQLRVESRGGRTTVVDRPQ